MKGEIEGSDLIFSFLGDLGCPERDGNVWSSLGYGEITVPSWNF